MELDLTPEQIGVAFSQAVQQSYLPQYASVSFDVESGADKVIEYVDLSPAKVHNPANGPKTEGTDTVTPIEFAIRSVYKTITLEDRYEESEIAAAVEERLPSILALAIDQYPTGQLEGLTTPIFTETSIVDNTLDSWIDADGDLAADGFEKNAWILDARAKRNLIAANRNSVTNLGNVAVSDGADVLGAPARFHTKFAAPGELGYVLDGSGVFLAIEPTITVRHFGGHTGDYSLQLQNKIAVFVAIRMGVGLVPGAARRLVLAGS